MYIRILHFPLCEPSFAEVTDHFTQTIRPLLGQQPGFLAAHLVHQSDPAGCLLTTCWQNHEQSRGLETDPALQWALQQLAIYFAAQPTEYGFWL